MIEIQTPLGSENERRYIFDVLIGRWLGLPYRVIQVPCDGVVIRFSGEPCEIRLPDSFFEKLARDPNAWLKEDTLPSLPLRSWNSAELASDIRLVDKHVPVVSGDANPFLRRDDSAVGAWIRLPIDIFGAAFFMLSRYEEAVLPDRDSHERFPASVSLAVREGFIDRPIVDEYVEILWTAMLSLWPSLKRKASKTRVLVSCDIDSPFKYSGQLSRTVRIAAGDVLRRKSFSMAWQTGLGNWRSRRLDHQKDDYWIGLMHIMEVNEAAGRSAAFYFIPQCTDRNYDNAISLDHPSMRWLLREVHSRGHEIGVHPGYNTFRSASGMAKSVEKLRDVLLEEEIDQSALGGRQHYLRWDSQVTARLWSANELSYDSTLGFAERPGFRCGTCREYPLYDLAERRCLSVLERPLIVMECSAIAERYMGLGYTEAAFDLMLGLKKTCQKFGGDFTLLWHNSHFVNMEDKAFYSELAS